MTAIRAMLTQIESATLGAGPTPDGRRPRNKGRTTIATRSPAGSCSDGELLRYFRTIYLALGEAPPSDLTIAAVASVRLLLIREVGEERQRELVGAWNEELPAELSALLARGPGGGPGWDA